MASSSSTTTRRSMDERTQREQQQEATVRAIDETKDNIRRGIEEARREAPRFAQTVTDYQNEAADATREIADTFLDSQKDVINSMQSAWHDVADRTGNWMQQYNFWWTSGMMSPREMTDMYTRMVSSATANFAASTRMASNMMFAGIEATRTMTRYARDNAREISKMTSNNARAMSYTTRQAARTQSEGGAAASASGPARTAGGSGGATTEATTTGEEGGGGQIRGERRK